MDLLTVISACSVARDFTLVFAMIMTFSNGNGFMVKGAAELETPPLYDPLDAVDEDSDESATQLPRTRDAALAKLEHLRATGDTPVLGLLPVPPVTGRPMRSAWGQPSGSRLGRRSGSRPGRPTGSHRTPSAAE